MQYKAAHHGRGPPPALLAHGPGDHVRDGQNAQAGRAHDHPVSQQTMFVEVEADDYNAGRVGDAEPKSCSSDRDLRRGDNYGSQVLTKRK